MLLWRAGARIAAPAPPPPRPALPPAPWAPRSRRRQHHHLVHRPCSAKKPANNEEQAGGGGVLSKSVLLRSGVALFALGFVDAGYSGDWSRIGAISEETEELLKLGAYVVVPLSLALVFSVSDNSNDS